MAQVNSSATSSRTSSPPHTPRSRSSSIMKGLDSPSVLNEQPASQHQQQQQQQQQQFQPIAQQLKRSTTSENLLARLPSLHHHYSQHHHHHHHSHQEDSPITRQSNHQLSDAQLSNKSEDYELKEPIGYGSSAVVYGGIYKPSNRRVAVKVIDLDMFERNQIDELRRETALMALSKHPNVLRVYGSFVSGSKLYIITPYLSAGSCLDIMKTSYPDGFDEITIATILKQALEGLIYLHKNGHIHRDVKAGNLLMDEHGLVQLADFGVSSSLTENNEVRKTFVGTPCWMAPEVMEQAGYDFKADIWSFGITAIELAQGYAPYAKLAPMKVLMMTLSQEPPTLSRETAKHKFSKMIKEMIDLCLQKDPKKRPSAEKLLQHPFFRQAKKKDFLVKSVLAHVPVLEQRPHKKVPQKHITFESTDQWDFDTFSDGGDHNDSQGSIKNLTPTTPSAVTAVPTPKSSSEAAAPPVTAASTPSGNSTPITGPGNKKHISFGNVVIKTLPQHTDKSSPPLETGASYDSAGSPTSQKMSSPDIVVPTPHRKSRFVVGENQAVVDQQSTTHSQRSTTSVDEQISPQLSSNVYSPSEKDGVGLGISGNTMTPTPPISTSSQEVKKGRFSVNQVPQRSSSSMSSVSTPLLEHPPPAESALTFAPATTTGVTLSSQVALAPTSASTIMNGEHQDFKSMPVSRVGSNDSLRKSRFAVHHSPMAPALEKGLSETLPLSRNASVSGCAVNGKISRFSVAKEDAKEKEGSSHEYGLSRESSLQSHDTPNSTIQHEGRKKGRFQLSGIGDIKFDKEAAYMESPQSSVSSYSPNSSLSRGQSTRLFDPSVPAMVYSHMESLYKQAEMQKVMLHDMLAGLSLMTGGNGSGPSSAALPSSSTPSSSKFGGSDNRYYDGLRSRSGSLNAEISHTFDHLQHLLQVSCKEREHLQKENEALKRELTRLRSLPTNTGYTENDGNQPRGDNSKQQNGITSDTSSSPAPSEAITGDPVVDPLPPSNSFDYFVPPRPHTTSPSTTVPQDMQRLKSQNSTIHLTGSPLKGTTEAPSPSASLDRTSKYASEENDSKDLSRKSREMEASQADDKAVPSTTILPTPSSSYSRLTTNELATDNATEILSDVISSPLTQ